MVQQLENVILDIYKGYNLNVISASDINLTDHVIAVFNKYDIDITDDMVLDDILFNLKHYPTTIWMKPYIVRLCYDSLNLIRFEQNKFLNTGRVVRLQDIYKDFKKGLYHYNILIHHIARSKELIDSFHLNNRKVTPKYLFKLLQLLYEDIDAFEENKVIQTYLKNSLLNEKRNHIFSGRDELNINETKSKYHIKKTKQSTKFIHDMYQLTKKLKKKDKYNCILDGIKKKVWLYQSLNVLYRRQKTYQLHRQFKLNHANIPNRDEIIDEIKTHIKNDTFYFSDINPSYENTERQENIDRNYKELLYEIEVLPNLNPPRQTHMLYSMLGMNSDVLKIGRTMNSDLRLGLYSEPINKKDSYFENGEVVMMMDYVESYGKYKKNNNYKNGLTEGTAKFFAAEYIFKQLMYLYCNHYSNCLVKYKTGLEWFIFKTNTTNTEKGSTIHDVEKLMRKANNVVENASGNCKTANEVKKEINYNESVDVPKWLHEAIY